MHDLSPIAAVDVAYSDETATVACVTFDAWQASEPTWETVLTMPAPAPYVPGQFYKRELPCIVRVLQACPVRPTQLVIDGYVWLDDERAPGLGGHVWSAFDEEMIVVGVAKSLYHPPPPCAQVLRGTSRTPLYVSAAGMTVQDAAQRIVEMHGAYRVPTLLRRVDQLSRGVAP